MLCFTVPYLKCGWCNCPLCLGSFNLHHFQSVTGIMIVVNTDARTGDIQAVLQQMYLQYVDLVVHNPLAVYKPDEPISSPLFGTRLDEYLSTQPFYK